MTALDELRAKAEQAAQESEDFINRCYETMTPERAGALTRKTWRLYKAQCNFVAALGGRCLPYKWKEER